MVHEKVPAPNKPPKTEQSLAELEAVGKKLAADDAELTTEIEAKTKARNNVRKERRSIESRITTKRMNGEA